MLRGTILARDGRRSQSGFADFQIDGLHRVAIVFIFDVAQDFNRRTYPYIDVREDSFLDLSDLWHFIFADLTTLVSLLNFPVLNRINIEGYFVHASG